MAYSATGDRGAVGGGRDSTGGIRAGGKDTTVRGSDKPPATGNVEAVTRGHRTDGRRRGGLQRSVPDERPAGEGRETVGGTDRRRWRPAQVLLLRQVAETGEEAHRRSRRVHL